MHRNPLATLMLSILAVLAASFPTFGDGGGHGGGGHGYQDGPYMYFDPTTMVTVAGELTQRAGEWMAWGQGNHTGGGMSFEMLADSGEQFELMLGPAWYLEDSGIFLNEHERVTVTGSRVDAYDGGDHHAAGQGHGGGMMGGTDGNHDYLIVTVIEADGVRLELRDDEGYPMWRGGAGWDDRWFDPSTITTLTGTLNEMLGLWSAWGYGNHTGNAIHYTFASDAGGAYYAMLGPWWYMEARGLTIEEAQRVELRGAIVDAYWEDYADREFFIATDITVGGRTVRLRDDWGYPLWHGTGWHYNVPAWRSANLGTLTGEVQKIRRRSNGRQLDRGYEVVLRTRGRDYTLHVAPDWFVAHLGMELRRGDTISAHGSKGARGADRSMVVHVLDAGAQRWRFRAKGGAPLWVSGAR